MDVSLNLPGQMVVSFHLHALSFDCHSMYCKLPGSCLACCIQVYKGPMPHQGWSRVRQGINQSIFTKIIWMLVCSSAHMFLM